jgi:hypothetical protein
MELQASASNNERTYRLFGNLFLEEPEDYVDKEQLQRLWSLIPYLHDCETRWKEGF